MSAQAKGDRLRVAAMVEAAELARQDAGGRPQEFLRPGLVQRAVLLDLIHLTESAERTSPGLKRVNSRFPWARLTRLRNKGLVHDDEELDLEDIWQFLHEVLPRIRRQLQRMRYPARER